jgi:hypothetical protein
MTPCKVLQNIPDMSQVSLYKTIKSTYLYHKRYCKLCPFTHSVLFKSVDIHVMNYIQINRNLVLIILGGNIGELHYRELTVKACFR